MIIFDDKNAKQKKLEVSFDKNQEIYEPYKTWRSIKKFILRKTNLSKEANGVKEIQTIKTVKSNKNDDRLADENNNPTTVFNSETVGILIHNTHLGLSARSSEILSITEENETETKINNFNIVHKIQNSCNRVGYENEKCGLEFKTMENEVDLTEDRQTEQAKIKPPTFGKNMEEIIDMFAEKGENLPKNKTNNTSHDLESNKNDEIKYFENNDCYVHRENKYDFITNTAKEYAKIFNKNLDIKNSDKTFQANSNESSIFEELSDEENNFVGYCDITDLKSPGPNESNLYRSVNMNASTFSHCTTKSGKSPKGDINDRNLEFRLEEAKRQSQLDKIKYKEETKRSDSLTPCDIQIEKGFFSDIIFFNEEKKGILTERAINKARRTGSLELSSKSLTKVPDIPWFLNEKKDDQILSESTEQHEKWRNVLQTIIDLNLSFNKLKSVSPKGMSFCSIKELRLNNNKIKEIPGEIGLLNFLSYLNLSYNHLTSLPLKLSSLKNLEEINLRRNLLQKLPDTFGNLVNLRKVDLSFNKLTKLPATFISLNSLIYLNLSFNELTQLPLRMMYLQKLENANLSYNYLSESSPMVDMRYLTVFDLTCNKLRHFPNFSGCIRLTELRLGINQIKEIVMENLYRCPLVSLMLPNNKLESIPDDISVLTRLEILDISNNLIIKLPWTLARLQHLTYVKVDNNKITNVKKSALENSPQSVLEILRNRLILYEGKDSPILKEIAEKEKKEIKERKEWNIQEENTKLRANKSKKIKSKSVEKITAKVKEKATDEMYRGETKKKNELEDSIHGLLDNVLKSLPRANKTEFKRSLTAHRSLICKEMNLSDLSVNIIKCNQPMT